MDQAPVVDPLAPELPAESASPTGPEPPPAAPQAIQPGARLLGEHVVLAGGMETLLAIVQVVLVSGIPTQLVVLGAFVLKDGLPPDLTHPTLQFVAMTSLVDTALVALLLRVFLGLSGETSHEVFVGLRRPFGEMWRGLAVVPAAIVAVQLMAYGVRVLFPGLHNVDENPYADYMRSPIEAAIFIVVVILAGGVREELQRAFIIRRFDQHLGGARVGLAVFTVLFGAMHYTQGWDAALVIGVLGLFFGVLYIRRQSAVLSITAHAGFDVGMVLLQYFGRALGI